MDGTVRPIRRTGENQRLVCNGHKRVNALKFQAVALPNGLRQVIPTKSLLFWF